MPEHEPDHRIQSPHTNVSAAPLSRGGTEPGEVDPAALLPEPRKAPSGWLFGGGVGLLLGGLTGLACCWLGGFHDSQWEGALLGALIGPFVGGLIGWLERKTRGDLARPDIATIIGGVYGLVPALLAFLQGLGGFRGGIFSGFALVGTVFIGSMFGILIGAMLDRAYEASRGNSWGTAIKFGFAGLIACAGLGVLLDWMMQGPYPEVVANDVKMFLGEEWRWRPELKNAKIKKVELHSVSRKEYAGFLDAMIAGQPARFSLKVIVVANNLDVEWTPIDQ